MLLNSRSLFVYSYLILFAGFYLGEDLNGNAKEDYLGQFHIILEFSKDVLYSLENYSKLEEGTSRQSPIFFLILSFIYDIVNNSELLRFLNFNLSFFSIIIFYKCLKILYFEKNNEFNITLVAIIFCLSPSFRSLSIWPNSINLGLLFFLISILFFLKYSKEKNDKVKFSNALYNVIFLSFASYISPNFSVFVIYYSYNYLKYFNVKKISLIFLLNILLCFPAIYYVFIDSNYFMFNHVVSDSVDNTINLSLFINKLAIITSIIIFHLIPFIFINSKYLAKIRIKVYLKLFITIFFLILIVLNFNYPFEIGGGGFFFKLSHFLFGNNYFYFFIIFFCLLLILNIINFKIDNFILVLCLLISIPQYSIYHKYFDPLILILWFLLFDKDYDYSKYFKKLKNIFFLYLFYLIFIGLNYIKGVI